MVERGRGPPLFRIRHSLFATHLIRAALKALMAHIRSAKMHLQWPGDFVCKGN
jgi:hypothetical protein